MRILERYILRRFLTSFCATLVILILAVIIVELLANLDEIAAAPGGARGAFAYVALRIPSEYLPYLIPVASFAAAFLCFGTAARSLEILAAKAGGISPLRLVVPLLAAAAVLAGAALLVNETLAVQASEAWRRQVRGERGPAVAFRRGSFWYHSAQRIYNVQEADSERRFLRGVTVYELDARSLPVRIVHAREAEIDESGDWVLRDVRTRTLDRDDPEAPPRLSQQAELRLPSASPSEVALLDADVAELSILDLREYLAHHPAGETGARRAATRLHERVTDPLTVLLFALLAVPLGLRVEQTRSLGRPALQGVVLVFLFYTARQYGSTLALEGVVPPALALWSVVALFASFGLWLLARVPR